MGSEHRHVAGEKPYAMRLFRDSRKSLIGFTLIELLVTVSIIACLAGLLMPALSKMSAKAQTTACAGNLRQIGIASLQYAADNNQHLPVIEPWPAQPVYSPGAGAQTMLAALGPYGVTAQTLRCKADVNGPNYYAKQGTSYQWFPGANNTNLLNVKSAGGLFLAFDYTNIHGNLSNVLFADGSVVGAVNH